MQRFEYRGPRFSVEIPAQLTLKDRMLAGQCTEIGKEGMKLVLGEPIEPNAVGTVSLSYQGQTLDFQVRVAHVVGTQVGLEFIYSSDLERIAVSHLVESLAAPHNRPGPVLIKKP